MKKYFIILLLLFLIPLNALANDKVNIYIFYSYTCPYSKAAITYLDKLTEERNDINLYKYEVTKKENTLNKANYQRLCGIMDINDYAVPLIFIGNDYIMGFDNSEKIKINEKIDYYKTIDYQDIIGQELDLIKKSDETIEKYKEPENKEINKSATTIITINENNNEKKNSKTILYIIATILLILMIIIYISYLKENNKLKQQFSSFNH